MAIKRKAKTKSKVKRRKAPAKRPASRKKVVRRAAKPAKKAAPRKVARKAPVRRAAPAPAAVVDAPGERIGVVTHFYAEPMVAVVKLEGARLRVGDRIHIRGHTSDFSQRVDSLQVEHAPVEEVGPEDDFGMKVVEHAREHDVVYRVK